MVEEVNLEGNIVYKCLKCGWLYRDKILSEKCEEWCKKNKSCNLDIIKHAVKVKK